ncbi:MAG: nitroreductase family protein [Eubacterium sp.]
MTITHLKHLIREIEGLIKHYKINENVCWQEQHEQYRIIKSMHGIEKGLSLNKVKVGFGAPKIISLMKRIEKYCQQGYDCSHEAVRMAMGAIDEYVEWHKEINELNSDIEKEYEILKSTIPNINNIGGTNNFYKADILNFNIDEFNKVLCTRHSIRNFSDEAVDIEKVKKAIDYANKCPSACNRQPTKIYIVNSSKGVKYLAENLQGIGGFADDCKMFLLVTGNVSAFDFVENNQWLVNAGIFVGTLELTLHSRGIASVVIQRPLVRSKKIDELRNWFDIPDNEEIVCIIGLGMYPDEFKVPASARLPLDKITQIK